MSEVKHGRGWVLAENVPISDELVKKLDERATHIYRDKRGNITHCLEGVLEEERRA